MKRIFFRLSSDQRDRLLVATLILLLIGFQVLQTWLVLDTVLQLTQNAASGAVGGPTVRDFLIRLTIGGVPIALLTFLAGSTLINFYRRNAVLARQMERQNEQLRALDKAKSDFLANVSHDLRTPLANLQMSLSGLLIAGASPAPDETRETLLLATEEVEQLSTRVRNLLEMSRIEARAYPTHREVGDLTDIVATALERLEPLTRGRELQANFPDTPLLIHCNSEQIETIIVNLIENALKYSPSGSAIQLRGWRRAGLVLFTVRDHGAGLKPGDEKKIFQKFYRSAPGGPIGGTGLGLAICKALASAHGGDLRARNAPDGGAEFGLSLPSLEPSGSLLTAIAAGEEP